MFKDDGELMRHMELRHWLEREDLEFKSGMAWDDLRPKIAKAALGMANLQGGGYIIVGVRENRDGAAHEIDAMPAEIARTYSPDDVSEYLNAHADPDIDVEVVRFEHGGGYVVAIKVHEFKEIPVICKKGIDEHVRRGTLYCRSPKPETVSVNGKIMREIIDMAVDKGIAKQVRRVRSYGVQQAGTDPFLEEASEEMAAEAQDVMSAIKQRGYWKIEIKPAVYRRDMHTLGTLRNALASSQVRYRGWPYPHIGGMRGKTYNMDRCVESRIRWGEFAEVSRFYRSGRFVHHIGMVEDRHGAARMDGLVVEDPAMPERRFLRARSALYYLTEMYLFASNLARREMLGSETVVDVTLYDQAGRILVFNDERLFIGDGVSQAQTIHLGPGRVTTDRLREEHDVMAVEDGIRLAEMYNVPADGLKEAMRGWQVGLYRRSF